MQPIPDPFLLTRQEYGRASVDTRLPWKEVLEAYYWDRLAAAYGASLAIGVGPLAQGAIIYRQIEGEYLTRKNGTLIDLAPWLSLEFVSDEVHNAHLLTAPILEACDEIAKRLNWDHSAPIMISVLTQEADAPWSVGRFGYFVDKYPYDKICIPWGATTSPDTLHDVVRHEYAHAIVLNVAGGHAPRWLDEMIAMIAQGGPDRKIAAQFALGAIPWLEPSELNVQYIAEREGHSGQLVYYAYEQSACIGKYLVDTFGEQSLTKLLTSFTDNSLIKEIAMRATNANPADEAIDEAYGLSEAELFREALNWLKSGVKINW